MLHKLLPLLTALALLTWGTPSISAETTAQDRERARGLLDEGDRKTEAQDHQAALQAYEAAHQIMGVPTTGIEVGRAQRRLGLLLEARDTWIQVSRYPKSPDEPLPFAEARDEAIRLAVAIVELIPTLSIKVDAEEAADTTLSLDGKLLKLQAAAVPIRVNPGKHTLRLCAPGFACGSSDVTLEEKETKTVHVTLGPPEVGGDNNEAKKAPLGADAGGSTPSSPPRTLVWVGYGLGGAGVLTGTVTGLLAFDRSKDAKKNCEGNVCDEAASPDIRASKTWGTVSTVSFGVGVAGLALGTWALLSQSRRASIGLNRERPTWAIVPDSTGASLMYAGEFP